MTMMLLVRGVQTALWFLRCGDSWVELHRETELLDAFRSCGNIYSLPRRVHMTDSAETWQDETSYGVGVTVK